MAFYSRCTRALTFENLHQDNALFNYNPSLVGAEDPPRPALDINSTATSSSTAGAGTGVGAPHTSRDGSDGGGTPGPGNPAAGTSAAALGTQTAGALAQDALVTNADRGSHEYVGWVSAGIWALPGTQLRRFDGMCELVRCAGNLQVYPTPPHTHTHTHIHMHTYTYAYRS